MINVLVPIVEKVEAFSDFVSGIKKEKVFVGIKKSLASRFSAKGKNIVVKVFDDKANKEEIINSLHSSKMEHGKILIARRPLTDQEYLDLTTSSADISTLKARHGKFVSFFKNLATRVVRRIFAFNFFEDISAICYGENMFELVSVCGNLSMATRVNKYVGVEIQEFETSQKSVAKEYSRPWNIIKFLLWTLLFVGSIAGGVCVCVFVPTRALHIVLVVFWIVLALMLWLVGLVGFTRTVAVGNLRYGRAQEV